MSLQNGVQTALPRVHFMDPLRGILMALGVLLHAGQVFNPDFHWLIHSSETTPVAAFLIAIVHVFRMPAFYIVSGFFALLTLQKYGASRFLKLRAEKILIPFAATAVILNSFERWMLQTQAVTVTRYNQESFNLSRYLVEGQWVSHLWFLGYLFAYVFLVFFAAKLFGGKTIQSRPKIFGQKVSATLDKFPIELHLLVLPIYYLGLVVLGKIAPGIYEFRFGFSVYDFLFYFQFFLYGFLLYATPNLFQRFTRISFWKAGLLLAFWFALKTLALTFAKQSGSELALKILEAYSHLLIVWISCHFIFSIFKKMADKPSKIASFLSSVSYTVYLFHHSLVILFGLLFIHYGIGGLVGFTLLSLLVSFIGVSLHVVFVSKYNWASYLFNGVRLRSANTTSSALVSSQKTDPAP